MMKNLLIGGLTLISRTVFSQEYKQKFAKDVCDCVKNIDLTNKTPKESQTQFGLCAFKHAASYKEDIKRDYGVDFTSVTDITNEEKMHNFGVQVGMLMVGECYEVFSKIMNDEEESDAESESPQMLISGKVAKIEKDNFVVFYVMGDNKNLTKFHWISTIESNLDLPKEYRNLTNKKVSISYYTTEIFDAKINDYKNINIISTLRTE